jgi:hypothetical protein
VKQFRMMILNISRKLKRPKKADGKMIPNDNASCILFWFDAQVQVLSLICTYLDIRSVARQEDPAPTHPHTHTHGGIIVAERERGEGVRCGWRCTGAPAITSGSVLKI